MKDIETLEKEIEACRRVMSEEQGWRKVLMAMAAVNLIAVIVGQLIWVWILTQR